MPEDSLERGCLRFTALRTVTMTEVKDASPRERGGVVDIDHLLEFAQYVKARMPGARVLIHQYGLRAIERDGDAADGPVVDWSQDWD